jgi:hypothetical protein
MTIKKWNQPSTEAQGLSLANLIFLEKVRKAIINVVK